MQLKLTPKQENGILLILFLCLGFFYQFNRIGKLPITAHPWAQSDKYALALGFLNNDFNFLKPETFLMNREFPHNFKKPADNSITSVNFPFHEFMVALLMKVMQNNSIGVFQLYNYIFSFIGLFALFKISRFMGISFLGSLSITIFTNLSPIFLIYQVSTLGIINTLSLVLLAIYFYLLFRKQLAFKFFFISFTLFTLACLIRSTALIPFIAIMITELFRSIANKKFYLLEFICVLASFTALWAHYQYMNLHMVYHYGSVFLYYLVPAKNLAEIKEISKIALEQWGLHYFSISQWISLITIVIIGLFLLFKQKQLSNRLTTLSLIAIFSFGGYFLFSIAMFTKFKEHDYYLLDTLYIPIILLLIIFLQQIEKNLVKRKTRYIIVTLPLLTSMLIEGKQTQAKAIENKPWLHTNEIIEDYKEASKKLDDLEISKAAKVLVIGAENCPNLPLTLLNRKGYILRWKTKEELENVLQWDYDFLLFRKQHFFTYYYDLWPDFLNHFEILEKKDNVVIAKPTKNHYAYKKEDFIDYKDYELISEYSLSIDNPSSEWSKIQMDSNRFGVVNHQDEFGLTFELDISLYQNNPVWLNFSFELFSVDSLEQAEVDLAVVDKEGNTPFYQPFTLSRHQKTRERWNMIQIMKQFQLPNHSKRIKLYFWNRGNEEFQYRNVKLTLHKKKSSFD